MINKLQKTRLGAWSDAGLCRTLGLMSALLLGLVTLPLLQAQTFTVLYKFSGRLDGANPDAGVIQDPAGNLYGTTYFGGDLNCGYQGSGCGVVFKVDTTGTEIVLHSFCSQTNCADGALPRAPVAPDKAGNIYGTTEIGGIGCNGVGCGTVFKIDTARNETVLYSFTGASDGCNPSQGLVVDKAGSLYGTTFCGGSFGWGTIFKVDSAGHFTLLHSFATGSRSNGWAPEGGHLAMDKFGNLYGVTEGGGAYNSGVLYKLTRKARLTKARLTVLHSFAGGTSDGCTPSGSVVQDRAGNLYGTTSGCGSNNSGTIWKVSKKGKETILHNFAGCGAAGGVARDSKGNLYGVGGCGANGYGALYELSAKGKLTQLHSFDYTDGVYPGEVLRTASGELFGTAWAGGSGSCQGVEWNGCGTVWKYVP